VTDRAIQPIVARLLPAARDTLVHCAQEMNHLAGILPAIYAKFAGE
jgi:hypothetical protein